LKITGDLTLNQNFGVTNMNKTIWAIVGEIEKKFERDNWTGTKQNFDQLKEAIIDMCDEEAVPSMEQRALEIQISDVKHELERPHLRPPDIYDEFLTLKAQLRRIIGED